MDKIIRTRHVLEQLGISKATLYRLINADDFPKPLQLGPRAVGWRQSTIDHWLNNRPATAFKPAPVKRKAPAPRHRTRHRTLD